MITQEQWLSMARSFQIENNNDLSDVWIEARQQCDGNWKWILTSGILVFNKKEMNFIYETKYPSKLTENHIADTRFDTYQEAYDCYLKYKSMLAL